jgi:NAD-dependent deacetylase
MLDFFNKFLSKKPKQKILIFCGAGISAESGLNTFRDKGGLWTQYNVDEVCNLKTFQKNRDKVFEFHNLIKTEILKTLPNKAHKDLANIQNKYGVDNVHIFTSNIDNLLEKAGCKNVCHVHGDIHSMKCLDCNQQWDIGNNLYTIDEKCPKCSSKNTKPNIIFFNEHAEKYYILNKHFESSGEIINKQIVPNIKLIVGTSFNVIPVHVFRVNRGESILVDPNPNIAGYERDFKKIIRSNAVEGVNEAKKLIEQLYQK